MDIEHKTSNKNFPILFIFEIVNIKWNGKQVENIKARNGQQISFLKRTIEDTCGVPSKKQKLLFKGKFLKVII
jgi:hypothetical protein